MVPILLVASIVALVAASLVAADARSRGLPGRTRRGWIGGVGVVSAGGFLLAYGFDGVLYRVYLSALSRPAVAPTPRALLSGVLLVGFAVSATMVLTYGFGSRYGPFAAR
jgi:hypothetical protein